MSFYSLKYCINPVLLDTKVSTKITAIIEGKYLLNSISNSSPSLQTSQLEAFHSNMLLNIQHFLIEGRYQGMYNYKISTVIVYIMIDYS